MAIPQISTAIFNMPEQLATQWAARALRDAQTNVREIRFILYNRGDADALQIADWMFEGAAQERTRPTHALTAPRRPTAPAVSAGPAARPAPAVLHALANYQARATAFRNTAPPALGPGETVADQVLSLAAVAAAVDGDRTVRAAIAARDRATGALVGRGAQLLPPAPTAGYGLTTRLSRAEQADYRPGTTVTVTDVRVAHFMGAQPGRPPRGPGHNVRFIVPTAQARAVNTLLAADRADVVVPLGAQYEVVEVSEPDHTGLVEIHLRDIVPPELGGSQVGPLPPCPRRPLAWRCSARR